MDSSPSSSPGTAAHVGRSSYSRPRPKVFSAPGSQTDSDSTLRNTSSSKSSGSCTEDTAGDATYSKALAANFPPKLFEAYQGLAPILRYSDSELMKRDIRGLKDYHNQLNAFVLKVIAVGYSCQWSEFNNFIGLRDRIAKVIEAKKATLPQKMQKHIGNEFVGMRNGLEFDCGPNMVAMKAEQWQEALKDPADSGYIRDMYKNASAPSNFGWYDVGAGGSEVRTKETDVLDYSLTYPQAKTLDYCTIPDTY